ncbi:MAG: AAA family ATPase [Deltaproteobacteria bacterium]|nr:AAA family ATPase [Deltaproteobacteria bacterium]
MTDEEQQARGELMDALLREARSAGGFPEVAAFRVAHEAERAVIDGMVADRWLETVNGRYFPTLVGLGGASTDATRDALTLAGHVLDELKDRYRASPGAKVDAQQLGDSLGWVPDAILIALTVLRELPIWTSYGFGANNASVAWGHLGDGVLDASWHDLPSTLSEPEVVEDGGRVQLRRVAIAGYRPFGDFRADLATLTVIIGANGAGKSALFDFLRFIGRAVEHPLPFEIDERSTGMRLFHASGAERIVFELDLDLSRGGPLRYEAEILGPVGGPRVARERLATSAPLGDQHEAPFVFLDFRDGRGVVRDPGARKLVRPAWRLDPNELALRRMLDPTLKTPSTVRSVLGALRFYSQFDVSRRAPIRRPVQSEVEPVLQEDGGNLSAVLNWLRATQDDEWQELQTHVRSVVPGFRSLNVVPSGGPGTVMASWHEDGVPGGLTLADLSDGTLRFLCWATLCLSPKLPPLICIDEPEIGLHPRVLPVLAGLFQRASTKSQVLIATHSPYFLSQFALDQIAVMRKHDGAAELVRPSSSNALRALVEELGSGELARLHISEELETLP